MERAIGRFALPAGIFRTAAPPSAAPAFSPDQMFSTVFELDVDFLAVHRM